MEVPEGNPPQALSPRTSVEELKLRRRPQNWRLACQTLVQQSLVVVTRPQIGLSGKDDSVAAALAQPLSAGPTAWPRDLQQEADAQEESAEPHAQEPAATEAGNPVDTTTSGELP